jgi:hypothetical protein
MAKSNMSFAMSICMEQLGSHWTDFDEILYLSTFRNAVQKIQVALKSDKIKSYSAFEM